MTVTRFPKDDVGMLLRTGDPAPNFNLETHDGGRLGLSDLKGRKVLLWFFPEADTPG